MKNHCWLLLVLLLATSANAEIIHREKSLYRDLYIEENDGLRCLIFRARGDRKSNQSCVYLQRPDVLALSYTRMAMAGLFLKPQPKRILVIGLGGGVLPRALRDLYPQVDITSVEIDPAVVAVAKRYFYFQEADDNRVVVQDARVFVKRAGLKKEQYDFVVLDAFNGDYIPGHLMTLEFFQEVKKIMTPDGVLVANTFSRSELVNHEAATYQKAFGEFYTVSQRDSGNRIILASNKPLPKRTEMHRNMLELAPQLTRFAVESRKLLNGLDRTPKWKRSAKVLTDQYSPVNVLNER
ncbi:fused MFS/spermidine synthase [Porticoccus sp. W117]|uniref:spermidine synthase n=1 Tax=Porticoccus sp. W117 TaxID=3054777 RepID=UPI002592F8BA|nr:fused MFS/spermidine synthase [Porticoccus sp. W117]MDM3872405.1 fused MFS/spermidine synthase [Porticoccus sp. W117]